MFYQIFQTVFLSAAVAPIQKVPSQSYSTKQMYRRPITVQEMHQQPITVQGKCYVRDYTFCVDYYNNSEAFKLLLLSN